MSADSDIFDDPEMQDAEEQLRVALVNALKGLSQGPTIHCVHSTGWDETGETFVVMCDMPDGTLGIWSFTPGQPVRYSVQDLGMNAPAPHPSDPAAGTSDMPLPGVVRDVAALAPGKRVTVIMPDGATYELPLVTEPTKVEPPNPPEVMSNGGVE